MSETADEFTIVVRYSPETRHDSAFWLWQVREHGGEHRRGDGKTYAAIDRKGTRARRRARRCAKRFLMAETMTETYVPVSESTNALAKRIERLERDLEMA